MPDRINFGYSDFHHRIEDNFHFLDDDDDHDDDFHHDFERVEKSLVVPVVCVVAAVCVLAAIVVLAVCLRCHRRRRRAAAARAGRPLNAADSEAARRPAASAPPSTGTFPRQHAAPHAAQAVSVHHPVARAPAEPCAEAEPCPDKEPSAPRAEELPPSYEQATGVKY